MALPVGPIVRQIPERFQAPIARLSTAEKAGAAFERFLSTSPPSRNILILGMRASLRVTVYSFLLLLSSVAQLITGKRQEEVTALFVQILGHAFFHPWTPLDVPPNLLSCIRQAEAIEEEFDFILPDHERKAILHAVILKSNFDDKPAMTERLYGDRSTALPSFRYRNLNTLIDTLENLFPPPPGPGPGPAQRAVAPAFVPVLPVDQLPGPAAPRPIQVGTGAPGQDVCWPNNELYYQEAAAEIRSMFQRAERLPTNYHSSDAENLAVYYRLAKENLLEIIDILTRYGVQDLDDVADEIEAGINLALPAAIAQLMELRPNAPFKDRLLNIRTNELTKVGNLINEGGRANEEKYTALVLAFILGKKFEDRSQTTLQTAKNGIYELARIFYENRVFRAHIDPIGHEVADVINGIPQQINVWREIQEHVR